MWKAGALIFALMVAGTSAWFGMKRARGVAADGSESTLTLETFVVNLNGAGQHAYLRVGITLGLGRALPSNTPEGPPIAMVRDLILGVLAAAEPDQLLAADGKQRMKGQILKALQEQVPALAVQNVYFTEFLVQR